MTEPSPPQADRPEGSEELPAEFVARLRTATSVAVITGAGISAESGVQTYRGAGGLYDDPEKGDDTVEALTGATLRRDADRTWRVVAHLARQSAGARPNPGHLALARIEEAVDRFAILTQNVDGLHEAAGSKNVIDLHGNVFRTRCMSCTFHGDLDRTRLAELVRAPRCPECRATLRPDVVLFGEYLPEGSVRRFRREFYDDPAEVVLAVGTSALFPYIIEPVLIAGQRGSMTVEVNPEDTEVSRFVRFRLRGPAGVYLPRIAEALARRG